MLRNLSKFGTILNGVADPLSALVVPSAAAGDASSLLLPCSAGAVQRQSRRWGFPRGHKHPPRLFFDFAHLKQITGGEYTTKPLQINRLGGRCPITRKKLCIHIGGGVKFDYFMLNLHPRGPTVADETYDERVIEVRRDPNRTPYIALVAGVKGKRWIYATQNMQAGQIIQTTCHIPERPVIGCEGNSYPLGALVEGTMVNSIELHRNNPNSHVVITEAGGCAEIIRHMDEFTVVRMPNKYEYAVRKECMAVVGKLSHVDWDKKHWGSAQMHRRFGFRMASGPSKRRRDQYQGKKHPRNPPLCTIDGVRPPPAPLQKFTLTKKQLSHNFGSAAVPQLVAEFNNLVRL
ncbi:hypothetical protein niasHS_001694 [Heterodera schachtii]|uniref:Ribosomal protein L2 C-terminal domain-containing protein n=1 Tax=Heterodera schachtii TaxID=97005 RepID=A0ABD2KBY4_HETSC